MVFFYGEVVEVDDVFGGGEEVVELVYFGLEGDFVEEFEEVDVVGVVVEVFFEEGVDGCFEYESVVDGDYVDVFVVVLVGFVVVGDG